MHIILAGVNWAKWPLGTCPGPRVTYTSLELPPAPVIGHFENESRETETRAEPTQKSLRNQDEYVIQWPSLLITRIIQIIA